MTIEVALIELHPPTRAATLMVGQGVNRLPAVDDNGQAKGPKLPPDQPPMG